MRHEMKRLAATMTTVEVVLDDVEFFGGSATPLAGCLYAPAVSASTPLPAVVMCHGFGGTKEGTPPAMARALATAGFRVLTWDYRGFGASAGPRGRLVPGEQVTDALHAVHYMASRSDVDDANLSIYGSSFGGAVVSGLMAYDPPVRSVVLVVPVASGASLLMTANRRYEFQELARRARSALQRNARAGEATFVARDTILPQPPSSDASTASDVELDLESVLHVVAFDPASAVARSRTPTAILAVADDELVPLSDVEALFERLACAKELHVFDSGGHYALYNARLAEASAYVARWYGEHAHPASSERTEAR